MLDAEYNAKWREHYEKNGIDQNDIDTLRTTVGWRRPLPDMPMGMDAVPVFRPLLKALLDRVEELEATTLDLANSHWDNE